MTTQCKHFTGIEIDDHAKCKVGIRYAELLKDHPVLGRYLRLPCITSSFVTQARTKLGITDVVRCDQFAEYTVDELKARAERAHEALDKVERVLRATMAVRREMKDEWRRERKSVKRFVECPLCANKMHLISSAHNGHVCMKCETPHCHSSME